MRASQEVVAKTWAIRNRSPRPPDLGLWLNAAAPGIRLAEDRVSSSQIRLGGAISAFMPASRTDSSDRNRRFRAANRYFYHTTFLLNGIERSRRVAAAVKSGPMGWSDGIERDRFWFTGTLFTASSRRCNFA